MGFWKVYQLHTEELVDEEEKLMKVRHQAHGWHLEHPKTKNNQWHCSQYRPAYE